MPTTTINVENCLKEYRAGNQPARNELLRHAQRRLEMLIHRMHRKIPVRASSSDILIDVMVRMDQALQRVALPSARDYFNLAAMHIRYVLLEVNSRYPPAQLSEPENILTVPEDQPLLDFWRRFHEWISSRPDGEREVWNHMWYHGLTQVEAAASLGVSRSMLRRRWQDARLRFRERFDKELRDLFGDRAMEISGQ
jgi:RNA polymerase sigma factor (sigma-70 family)